ncbi:MAG TPA: hypothetical protein VN824_18885, partial [Puia sp.]|nr:hypothetical protein [Puia sp.]
TTCPAITSLFMKYSVDGVSQTITGDRATPTNPYLLAQVYNLGTYITTGSPGKSLLFYTGAFSAGTYNGSGIEYLSINGKYYNFNPVKPMRVTFDRYDLLTNGLVTGSADFYYDDQSSITHHVECSFQLVRTAVPYDFLPYPPF